MSAWQDGSENNPARLPGWLRVLLSRTMEGEAVLLRAEAATQQQVEEGIAADFISQRINSS